MLVAWSDSLDVPASHSITCGRFSTFRFALVTTDGQPLDAVAYARPDSKPGDVTSQGLRVVRVLERRRDNELPVLVVEPVGDQ